MNRRDFIKWAAQAAAAIGLGAWVWPKGETTKPRIDMQKSSVAGSPFPANEPVENFRKWPESEAAKYMPFVLDYRTDPATEIMAPEDLDNVIIWLRTNQHLTKPPIVRWYNVLVFRDNQTT